MPDAAAAFIRHCCCRHVLSPRRRVAADAFAATLIADVADSYYEALLRYAMIFDTPAALRRCRHADDAR